MLIFDNVDRLAFEGEQVDDPAMVVRCQAGVAVEGKSVFFRKADNPATGGIVVIMRLEAMFRWCGWFKAFV